MRLSEVIRYANGEVLNPSVFKDYEIVGGCGADLMSDVLTAAKPGAVLLNIQRCVNKMDIESARNRFARGSQCVQAACNSQ